MLLATLLLWGGAAGAIGLGVWPVAVPLLIVWVWVLSFFRDPRRVTTCEAFELCAPADGRVTEISRLDGYEAIEGPALRIGIFLSLFNVHVNRSPCAGVVRSVRHEAGLYLDARHPESGAKNESNTLVIDPAAPLRGPVIVRQVAGLVARRIICHTKPGDGLAAGERFGMIKFGSRTELIVPAVDRLAACVRIGDSVSGGTTVLARYNVEQMNGRADTLDAKAGAGEPPVVDSAAVRRPRVGNPGAPGL